MADAAAAEGGKKKKEAVSKSARAGLTFAVSRIDKKLRHARIAKQIGTASSVFLTGAVEHVIEHVLKKADEEASARKSKRVTEQHIIAAVRSDPDLARAFLGFCFSSDADVPKTFSVSYGDNEPTVNFGYAERVNTEFKKLGTGSLLHCWPPRP